MKRPLKWQSQKIYQQQALVTERDFSITVELGQMKERMES
jgi:hypothetical protein